MHSKLEEDTQNLWRFTNENLPPRHLKELIVSPVLYSPNSETDRLGNSVDF